MTNDENAQVLHINDLRYGRSVFERWYEQNSSKWAQVSKKKQRYLRHTIILAAAFEIKTLQEAADGAAGE